MPDVAVTVIGGGAVGLAVARELAALHAPVVLLERNERYGMETSSRNSEVIHAGIYYTPGSLKATLCVEGKHLLYEMCEKHDIPHRRFTKIITATTPQELVQLEAILAKGNANGAELSMLTAGEVQRLEPRIATVGGIFSPTTGIISAHGLMDFYAHQFRERGGEILSRCAVTGVERTADGYRVAMMEQGRPSDFTSAAVVNAAGLESDTIASLAGIDVDAAGYRLAYCKGSYFALPGSYRTAVQRLVYPVPTPHSLGVHAVLDLTGRIRFGPDAEYLGTRTLDYSVDESKRPAFAASVRRILPFVQDADLTPDLAGIRPKLQKEGEPVRDFVIEEESGRGLPGFVNLIGIESPGLTASPAIARMVARMLAA
jgi:L-2-hydroxyglutarate oxidase LhgO